MSKSQIDVLASLVHPRNGRKWRNRFVMIEAYYDESGIHEGARVCTVGGFYGTQCAWRKLEAQWNKVLEKHGLLDCGFHSKVFFRRDENKKRVGPYADWSDDKAEAFLDQLVQVILRNRVFPIGHGVLVAHWNALQLDVRKWLTGAKLRENGKFDGSGSPNKSYYIAFQFCVLDSLKHSGVTDKIHFFAGIDRTFSEYASLLYKGILADQRLPNRHLLGGISYPLAKDTPGLQAADLLVYTLYQHNKARLRGTVTMRPLLKRMLKNRKQGQRLDLLRLPEFKKLVGIAEQIWQESQTESRP